MSETYLIVIGKTATGSSAHCQHVSACAAVCETVEEVPANTKTALELYFEGMIEDGDAIPKPGGVHSHRKVMKELDADRYILGQGETDTSRFTSPVAHS